MPTAMLTMTKTGKKRKSCTFSKYFLIVANTPF